MSIREGLEPVKIYWHNAMFDVELEKKSPSEVKTILTKKEGYILQVQWESAQKIISQKQFSTLVNQVRKSKDAN